MPRIDPDKLAAMPRYLALAFYALLALALLVALAGSPSFAFVLLIAGGCLHVARVGLEEVQTPVARRPRD